MLWIPYNLYLNINIYKEYKEHLPSCRTKAKCNIQTLTQNISTSDTSHISRSQGNMATNSKLWNVWMMQLSFLKPCRAARRCIRLVTIGWSPCSKLYKSNISALMLIYCTLNWSIIYWNARNFITVHKNIDMWWRIMWKIIIVKSLGRSVRSLLIS